MPIKKPGNFSRTAFRLLELMWVLIDDNRKQRGASVYRSHTEISHYLDSSRVGVVWFNSCLLAPESQHCLFPGVKSQCPALAEVPGGATSHPRHAGPVGLELRAHPLGFMAHSGYILCLHNEWRKSECLNLVLHCFPINLMEKESVWFISHSENPWMVGVVSRGSAFIWVPFSIFCVAVRVPISIWKKFLLICPSLFFTAVFSSCPAACFQ